MAAETKVAFVTNMCPHYRIRTFETLAAQCSVNFYFYSAGREWYWQQQHGVRKGNFPYQYLAGFTIGGTRITPTLISKLLADPCDVFVKCINGRFALPVTYLIARLRKRPFVLWTGVWMKLSTPFHRLIFPLTRHIYRNADAVVVYGEHVRRYLLSEGVAGEKIFVASHAVDNEMYSREVSAKELQKLRETLGISSNQRVVLYLGRLEPNKGLTYLLEAFELLASNDAVLVIAGDGAERQRLQQLSQANGLFGKVRFGGYVAPHETPAYYALAYALVLPSITTPSSKELWGLVINEAMNQGCPVIATDAVGAAAGGLVRDGETGLVVRERSSSDLASALRRLLTQPDLRDRLGGAARKAVAGWGNEQMVLGFRRALDYVLGSNRDFSEPVATATIPSRRGNRRTATGNHF